MALAFLIGAGCGGLPSAIDDGDGAVQTREGYPLTSALFVLDVDTEGVTLHEGEAGFTVTNDLGHLLEVREAWLSFSAMSLASCPSTTAALNPVSTLSRALIGTARAGHGEDYGPASVLRPLVEDLASPASTDLGAVDFEAARFCHAHYLAGYAPDTAEHLERAPLMAGRTLLVAGWVTRPGEARQGFFITTDLNYGQLVELKELMGGVTSEAVTVTVTRSLRTMFDGVDVVDDEEPGASVLWNLAGGARLSVTDLDEG